MINQNECIQCEDYLQNYEFEERFACPCCYEAQKSAVEFYRDLLNKICSLDEKTKQFVNDAIYEHGKKNLYANFRELS